MTTTETERAEEAALDAWVQAEDARNREGYWLAMTLLAVVKDGTVTLPDFLAPDVEAFERRCAEHDEARAAYVAARDAAKAEAVRS